MTIFLGYTTALRYWRSMRAHNKYGIPMERSSAQPAAVPSPAEERAAEEAAARVQFCPHDEPLHVVVGTRTDRRKTLGIIHHVHTGSFARRSFVLCPNNVYMSSPELCFLQMAGELEIVDLMLLGLEFCGSYSMRPRRETIGKSEEGLRFEPGAGRSVSWFDEEREEPGLDPRLRESGFYSDRQPLVSAAQLKRFVGRCDGFHGIKRAREALRYVLDDAASPMEAKLLILLCLPRAKGGYGLPMPVLNKRYDPRTSKDWRAEKGFYRCDLCWENDVVVEYESDMWHSGKNELEKDSVRRNDLSYMGNTVVCVTAGQLYSRVKMDKVAALLRKKLGIRVNEPRYDYVARQRDLRRALLGVRW